MPPEEEAHSLLTLLATQEENQLLKYKVDILLDMVTVSSLDALEVEKQLAQMKGV